MTASLTSPYALVGESTPSQAPHQKGLPPVEEAKGVIITAPVILKAPAAAKPVVQAPKIVVPVVVAPVVKAPEKPSVVAPEGDKITVAPEGLAHTVAL